MAVIYINYFHTIAKGGVLVIQLTVTDTLQNFTNDYIFETQDDMIATLHMLFDFADYTNESIQQEVLRLHVTSDRPWIPENRISIFNKNKKGKKHYETRNQKCSSVV